MWCVVQRAARFAGLRFLEENGFVFLRLCHTLFTFTFTRDATRTFGGKQAKYVSFGKSKAKANNNAKHAKTRVLAAQHWF